MTNINNIDPPSVFDRQAFKHSISMVESSGGKYMDSKTSSAAGRYHFLYNNIKKNPVLNGMTKLEFMKDVEMQERIMDMAIDGELAGYPNYSKRAAEYRSLYAPDLSLEETAAMIHFLGAGGARQALKGNYKIPGKNASKDQYLNRFRKHYQPTLDINAPAPVDVQIPVQESVQDNVQVAPAVPVQETEMPKQQQPIEQQQQQPITFDQNFLQTQYEGNDSMGWLQNQNAFGGEAPTSGSGELIKFANGGTHESNPHGGIPIGHDDSGVLNTVEENETMHKLNGKDYIFSDRLGLNTFTK